MLYDYGASISFIVSIVFFFSSLSFVLIYVSSTAIIVLGCVIYEVKAADTNQT